MSTAAKTSREIDNAVDVIAGQYRDPDTARFAINDFRDWLRGEGMSESLTARFADLPARPAASSPRADECTDPMPAPATSVERIPAHPDEGAHQRMEQRRALVRSAREQFRRLPEDVQRHLKADHAAANERAAEIVRHGQYMRPAQPVPDATEGRQCSGCGVEHPAAIHDGDDLRSGTPRDGWGR